MRHLMKIRPWILLRLSRKIIVSRKVGTMVDRAMHVLPNSSEVCVLECTTAFQGLTDREKLYAHHLGQASWSGSLICLLQTSPESPGIFLLIRKLFKAESVESLQQAASAAGVNDEEFQAFLVYAAGFLANMGNYKSFGDTKFIPNLPQENFEKVIKSSDAYKSDREGIHELWSKVSNAMYALTPRLAQLDLGDKGLTTYFSSNCTKDDAEIVQEFMKEKDLSAYNTRLFKTLGADQKVTYEIRLASSFDSEKGGGEVPLLGSHEFTPKNGQPVTVKVTRGDYSALMAAINRELQKAKEHCANETESEMLSEYVRCFAEGSIDAHKNGSRFWIRNKGPIIETYIGFIESYRDPYGVRGEFEGFVAMVNKEMSKKFATLVERAEHFLPLLPWPACYEKDKFLQPDFTSLDVLAFGSSGIPAGINIPNYDDIRQSEGFKNVSLGNVLSAGYKDTKITFLTDADKELYAKLKAPSFEVQVGIHELLGHGSGKLFQKDAEGKFNFDTENVKHALTNEKISSWYQPTDTYDTVFKEISSSFEECRAECVGIYLCLSSEIISIFGHEGADADDIIYINWLNMARAGLLALEFYTPETSSWRQAHMQARYVILRVMLEAGDGLVKIEKITGSDGSPDLLIQLDRTKINTTGKTAIGEFLKKLQVYKATADYAKAKELYGYYSAVTDKQEPHFLSLRPIVLQRKQPRKMFVQSNTVIKDGRVELKQYESSPAGLIQSFVERFPETDVNVILKELWQKDAPHFNFTS